MIGVTGINLDLADAMRTTLDNAPVWDWDPRLDPEAVIDQQGIKPTVRSAGRRWYLQDRVWSNHPDLIFFRSNTRDDTWPRLSHEEALAFCSFVGLSGGIVKLGDKLVDLEAEQLDAIRRLLPTYGVSARPLDVFTREFPEVWELEVEGVDGYGESYLVYGLFNWGWNLDLSENPPAEIPDGGSREHRIALGEGDFLAYEFWTGEFLGELSSELDYSVPEHSGRVIAVRERTGDPQFLGWNRQITMGGVLLESVEWDGSVLELRAPVVPGRPEALFTWELAFYLPEGAEGATVEVEGVEIEGLELIAEGSLARVRFDALELGEAVVSVTPES
ncbi:MAG TPA: hypothetical protein QGF58_28145 [Myxococcota bacterium]|nr:hypothetical protein [Myxococcota bacterium]